MRIPTGIIKPALPDLDYEEWRGRNRMARIKPMVQHWATHGFGAPKAIYLLYIAKIAVYAAGAVFFASLTPGLGSFGAVGSWWTEPVFYQKIVLWTLLFEVLGLGCGFGPLTLRFLPPLGAFLHWLRPGTIRLPPWPEAVPLTRGTRRAPAGQASRSRSRAARYSAAIRSIRTATGSTLSTAPMPWPDPQMSRHAFALGELPWPKFMVL